MDERLIEVGVRLKSLMSDGVSFFVANGKRRRLVFLELSNELVDKIFIAGDDGVFKSLGVFSHAVVGGGVGVGVVAKLLLVLSCYYCCSYCVVIIVVAIVIIEDRWESTKSDKHNVQLM